MAFAWVGTCKNKKCGKESIVRYAQSIDGESGGPPVAEIPNPERKSKVKCRHCGTENEFFDNELKHRDVSRLG
jgi:hypothetical protein